MMNDGIRDSGTEDTAEQLDLFFWLGAEGEVEMLDEQTFSERVRGSNEAEGYVD